MNTIGERGLDCTPIRDEDPAPIDTRARVFGTKQTKLQPSNHDCCCRQAWLRTAVKSSTTVLEH